MSIKQGSLMDWHALGEFRWHGAHRDFAGVGGTLSCQRDQFLIRRAPLTCAPPDRFWKEASMNRLTAHLG
jgi:hypothetical protein